MQLLYDGHCPLCIKEMAKLKQFDVNNKIDLVDIRLLEYPEFNEQFPNVDKDYALKILHGINRDGTVLLGLDANVHAWELVGKYKYLKILRVWPVKWFADLGYLFFAKYRMQISRLFLGASCDNGQCRK